jgi:hypothetical protein
MTRRPGGPIAFQRLPDADQKDRAEQSIGERQGKASLFTCPDCGGTLWRASPGPFMQFRCHLGPSYTGQGLANEQGEVREQALWFSIRTLVDKSVLLRQLARNTRSQGDTAPAERFEQHAATFRRIVEEPEGLSAAQPAARTAHPESE